MILKPITVPAISTMLLPLSFWFGSFSNQPKVEEFCLEDEPIIIVKEKVKEKVDSSLVHALINVESRGNSKCLGDLHLGSPSVGVLQIRPIMVREINRILKIEGSEKRFKKKDRFSREKSIEMFYIWKNFHHKGDSDEVIARCWNGGPKGWKSIKTQHYWNKVQKELKKQRYE